MIYYWNGSSVFSVQSRRFKGIAVNCLYLRKSKQKWDLEAGTQRELAILRRFELKIGFYRWARALAGKVGFNKSLSWRLNKYLQEIIEQTWNSCSDKWKEDRALWSSWWGINWSPKLAGRSKQLFGEVALAAKTRNDKSAQNWLLPDLRAAEHPTVATLALFD